MSKSVIPLDDLLNETAGHVSIGGVEHAIAVVNAAEYQRIVEHEWSTGDIRPILDIVKRVAPSIPAETLTLRAVTKITQIAVGIVEQVEDALPNSSGPATESLTPAVESHAP